MKEKVSVIVPVYNAQNYIEKCIDSILGQSYDNIELILVDDGSPDGCPDICDRYANDNTKVKVLHKDNEGVSAARNDGLSLATGKYIQFVDSDDYLEKDMIEKMVKTIEGLNCDMALCGFNDTNMNHINSVLPSLSYGRHDRNDYLHEVMKDPFSLTYGVLWNKLFKKKLIDKGVCFSNDMNFGEDFIFCLNYMEFASTVGVVGKAMYNYVRFNDKSLMFIQTAGRDTADKYINYMEKRLLIFKRYKEFFEKIGLYEDNKELVYEYVLRFNVEEKTMLRISALSKNDRKQCVEYINNSQHLKDMKQTIGLVRRMAKTAGLLPYSAKAVLRSMLIKNKA